MSLNKTLILKKIILNLFVFLFLSITIFLFLVCGWIVDHFGQVKIDEILFTIFLPLKGTPGSIIDSFIKTLVYPTIISSALITAIVHFVSLKISKFNIYKIFCVLITISFLFSAVRFCINYDVFYYISHKTQTSNFYEQHYVDAKSVNITVPKHKKNLILIFLESMEFTFSNEQYFGTNLIPELMDLSNENISFKRFINGYRQGATQTALVADMTGLPTSRFIYKSSRLSNLKNYLSGVYALGEILKDNGYETLYIQGSDVEFAGADTFLKNHGFENIIDGYAIIARHGMFSNKWFVPDEYTIQDFKDNILNFKEDKPFCAVMITSDTHCGDPVLPNAKKFFNNDKLNAIRGSSYLIGSFVKWVQQQSFAKDTVIILVGDHLRMEDTFMKSKDTLFTKPLETPRYVYNVFINTSYKSKQVDTDRYFCQFDLFPTILEAIDFKVQGSRLGLGTSLFSSERTLLERLGKKKLTEQLAKNNKLYNSLWQSK